MSSNVSRFAPSRTRDHYSGIIRTEEDFMKDYEKVRENISELEEKLNNNVGNAVLVVEQEDVSPFYEPQGCFPSFPLPKIDTVLNLGVLNSEVKLFDKSGNPLDLLMQELPTDKHVRKHKYSSDKWSLVSNNMVVGYLIYLGQDINPFESNIIYTEKDHGLLIYFGKEVENYFSDDKINYVEGLKPLEVEAPKEFQKAYHQHVREVARELFNKFNSEERLRSIDYLLERAFELDLHKTKLTLRPQKGTLVRFPQFFLGLAEKYGIEVPK